MATYDVYKLQATPSANPVAGESRIMRGDVDFDRMRAEGRSVGSGDVLRVIRLKDNWIIKNAWYRVKRAGTTATVDIGTADNGTQIVSNLAMQTAGDWKQGTIGKDSAGTGGAHVIMGDDGYIFVSPDAAVTSGLLEVMVEVIQGPGTED